MKKIIGYFLHGLLFTVPAITTIYVVFKLFYLVDGLLPLDQLLPFKIPGLGLIIIFLFIAFMGYLGSFYFAGPMVSFVERLLEKTPLLKLIYTSVKDLVSAFVGEKKRFNQPVLVTLNKEAGLQRIGFITQNDLSQLSIGKEKVAVYLPYSYSFAGTLVIVPRDNVVPVDASGTEMMKFVISGGVTEI